MVMAKHKISLCMMVRNEARFLGRCLESAIRIADQVIVVDTGSTDRSAEIAKAAGAELYFWPWQNNFSLGRQETMRHATGDWILILDGDEVLDDAATTILSSLDLGPNAPDAYQFQVINYTTDRMIEAESSLLNQTRLFRNQPRFQYRCNVHNRLMDLEQNVMLTGPVVPIRVHHYGYIPSVWSQQNKDARLTLLEKAARDTPNDPLCHYHLGIHLKILERWTEALTHFETAMVTGSLHQEWAQIAHFSAAYCASKIGEHRHAIAFCDRLLKVKPWLADAHARRAEALIEVGEYQSVVDSLQRLLASGQAHANKLSALNFVVPYRLGRALHLLGRDAEAAEIFQTLATPNCTDITVWTHLTLCRARAGDLSGAQNALAGGFRLAPEDPDLIQLQNAQPPDKIATLQQHLRSTPTDGGAWNDLGVLLFEAGHVDAAKAALVEAVKVEPTNADAAVNLKALYQWLTNR